MIGFNRWYRFIDKNDKRLFLDYFKYLRVNQIGCVVNDLDETYPSEFLNAECLKINIDNGYHINYRTKYNPEFMRITEFGHNEREFILNELYCKGDNKMAVSQEPKTTIRDIMEREFRKERIKLEKRCDELINDAYASCPMGEQAKLLANLIMANTTLEIDFKTYLTEDILPLGIRREIIDIRAELETEMAKLSDKYQNLEAMLSICDTYEQKEKLLKKNHIIK